MDAVLKYLKQRQNVAEKMKVIAERGEKEELSLLETETILYMGENGLDSKEIAKPVGVICQAMREISGRSMAASTFTIVVGTLRSRDYIGRDFGEVDNRQHVIWLKEKGQTFYQGLEKELEALD